MHTHRYRQVKCGCEFIVCLWSSQHYLGIRYDIYLRSSETRRELERKTLSSIKRKKHKKRRERTPRIDSLRVAIRRDLDTPGEPYSTRRSRHSQTKTETFGPSCSKSKRKGNRSRRFPFFSISLFFLSISIFLFLTLLLPPSLSLSLTLARSSFLDWSTGNILESTAR